MSQLKILTDYIMAEVDGEPSRNEGAADTAIRIIKQLRAENKELRSCLKTHGCHHVGCQANGPGGCNCGLQKALEGKEAKDGKEVQ